MILDRLQFQWTLTVCLILAFATTSKGSQLISLMPNDPEGLVGQDMHLWCSVSEEGKSLRDANFTIVYRDKKTHHRFPASDSVVLNATTVMLTISNLTDAHDRAMVFCWADGESEFQIIKVGQAPIMPEIFKFRYLNWEKFVFEWRLKPIHNGFTTKYTAWFKGWSDMEFTPCDVLKCDPGRMSICIAQNEYSCTVPTLFLKTARSDGFILFKVNGTNNAGNVTSDTFEKNLEKIVEPGPVKNLRFQIINGSDRVSYQLPDVDRHLKILFRLASKEENLNEEYEWDETQIGKRLQNVTLPYLNPHTEYQLFVRAKYALSPFRSEWKNVTFTSHEEAPSQAPKVCGSCFERERNTLTVHFQPLTREQSRGNVTYTTRLLSLSNGSSVPEQVFRLRYSKGTAVFKLSNVSPNVAYHLNISASTSAGSSRSTYIEIPTMSEVPSHPTNCTVMSVGDDAEQVIVRWNDTESSSQGLKTYTIFWCNGSTNRLTCDDPLEWRSVGANESSALVTLNGGYSGYMFGIGATTVNGKSSGIQWSCFFYDIRSVGLSPYIHPRRNDETAIEIWLEKPPYNPRKGFIYGYNLYYAEHNDGEFKKIYSDDRTAGGMIVVDGLASGKSYLFRAESLTVAGPSDVNATTRLATQPFTLSAHAIGGIVVGLVFILIFAVFGCIYCLRYPFRFRDWIEQLKPCMPEVVTEKSYYDEQYPAVPSDYCVVVETSSEDDDSPNRQDDEERDTVLNYSALRSIHECVSLSGSTTPIFPSGLSCVESHPTKIVPFLDDCFAKPEQRPQVVNSLPSDRFANSSDAESDYLTNKYTASSDENKDRAFLVPENSRIDSPCVGVSRAEVVGDPDEMCRLLPSVTEHRHPRPSSLLIATRNSTTTATVSASGLGPVVFEPVLSVLPQMTAVTSSSVLPSVRADEKANDSDEENILPKISTNFVGRTTHGSEVGTVCCEVSSASSDGSSGTGDRTRSTGVSPVDPSSFRSSLSGYSSSCDGTEASYVTSSDRTNTATSTSNPDDEGIYI